MRGERDYTQRVMATIRPAGIIAGRLVTMEDFESLIPHSTAQSPQFSFTSTEGEVWEGDAAGKLTIAPAPTSDSFNLWYPVPTPDVMGIEAVFKPLNEHVKSVALLTWIWNGETLYKNSVKIYDDETNLLLQILDPSQAYKTIHTFPGSSLYEQWHVIYVRFNCDTLLYEMAQYDGTRVPIQTEPFYSIANTQTPSGYTRFNVERKTGETAIIAFDNIAVSYEEL